ncbi:DciA family protein [Thalassotalea profundi]|uniref:DUF721 domain-containing protein n=1 Tax=Thalassotalea profundi TaxID=2036687 RepID=A0ABQ3IVI3_9GAMM|nr:DciA family protein [Thalassotalea profundi]GHE95102.1 hypothetical protein GCM10011501_25780 [Thalassotalea profundi]
MAQKSKLPIDMSTLFSETSGTLAQIAKKTNSLKILADIVRQSCPDLPAEVWQIANFTQNTLVIEVNSAIWGQRLQFEKVKICQQLAIATDNLFTQVSIKVSPYRSKTSYTVPISDKKAKTQYISSATAHQLNEVAKNAPESLKKKLLKLASLADKSS